MAAVLRTCSVPGCNEPHKALGYCGVHRERVRRHGHPNPDEPVRKRASALAYFQSLLDTDTDECIITIFGRSPQGYPHPVLINGKSIRGHVAVCEMAHGPKPEGNYVAAHSCGNGHLGCVNPKHLRWATYSQNMLDRIEHGTSARGEKSPVAKLTEAAVRYIRKMHGILTQAELAKAFGVSVGVVDQVHRRKIWEWLADDSDDIDPAIRVYLSPRQREALKVLARYGDQGARQARLNSDEGFPTTLLTPLLEKGFAERIETSIGVAWFITAKGRLKVEYVPPTPPSVAKSENDCAPISTRHELPRTTDNGETK